MLFKAAFDKNLISGVKLVVPEKWDGVHGEIWDVFANSLILFAVGVQVNIDLRDKDWWVKDDSMDPQWLEIDGDEELDWPDVVQIKRALNLNTV